ncbi:hypothetical protein C1H46_018082 [Malus baccata]|uniref:Uncharacterized protein n=1 Tax=Malus baccata TaxID=106549 RepID=A0A540MC68_MALBA|nr:hypothetical protein C1H46_018082 [Malus baccata]
MRNGYQRNNEEAKAHIDLDISFRLVGVEDYQEEAEEAHHYVHDEEYTVDTGIWVEVGEVIDGCDESIPWEEVAKTQCEIEDIGQVEGVLWDFIRYCGGYGGEQEVGLRIFVGDFGIETGSLRR